MSENLPATNARDNLNAYLHEHFGSHGSNAYGRQMVTNVPTGRKILELEADERAHHVMESLHYGNEFLQEMGWDPGNMHSVRYVLSELRDALLRKALPFNEDQIIQFSRFLADDPNHYFGPNKGILAALERFAAEKALPEMAVTHLSAALLDYTSENLNTDASKGVRRLEKLVYGDRAVPIVGGEPWADAAIQSLAGMPKVESAAWIELLTHCQTTSANPSAKWSKEVDKKIEAIGREAFRGRMLEWLGLIDKARPVGEGQHHHPMSMIYANVDVLRGLAWCCSRFGDSEMARLLGFVATNSYKKAPGYGPRAIKLGNAAVHSLGTMSGSEGLAQLALLKVKIKFGTAQQAIEKALRSVAVREGLSRDEIEELAVPTYGMEEVGRRRDSMGDFIAELSVATDGSTELLWRKEDGKVQKSVPATVKEEFGEELKELKGAAKDIQKMLPAQRERIDGLFLAQKRWPLAVWRERYLDHPLVGVIARRVIWQFSVGDVRLSGCWMDGKLVDATGHPLVLAEDATVELWHPIGHTTDEIVAWRQWLERHEVRQPFKQAHREVYLLTDAELRTETYSNRFAAHIIRQHQFNALCGQRSWKNQLRLMVDAVYAAPSRVLPLWGLRAEFWVEGAGTEYGTDTNDTGTYLYLATDQVRFYPLEAQQLHAHAGGGGYGPGWRGGEAPQPMRLDQVPPLVFSEVMRDVDLFVGVASVGNDPTWADGGPQGRYVDYWHSFSFGDLSATAQTRKAVLERIVLRLKIADRCSFAEKFLVVRGDLRTYKIHLGSGNILMEPNDQYLCIVADRSAAVVGDKVFLPFEGDGTLSIILSKALLLAADKKITDPTITRQIGHVA